MLKAYPAQLIDGHLCWTGAVPPEAAAGSIDVDVVIRTKSELTNDERRQRLKVLFEQIRQSGGITSIPDPAAWQREIRLDRLLPGRES